jgi:hypothetical protein
LQGFTLIPTSGQGHKWSPRSWNWPTRSRNPPIPAHSQALTAFRSTTYTCKNWKGLVIRLYARHQLWRANLTWELVIQKGRKEGVVGEGRGAKTLRVIKKTIIQTWGGGREIPTLHNRKAHQRCSSAGHNYFIIGNGSGPNGSCQVVHNPNRVFVSLSKVCLHLAQRLLKVVCHPLCQLNLLICASHESVHNLLTWCPVLKISKLFHQVTCTCFLSQFIWFQSMDLKKIKNKKFNIYV